MGFSISTTMFKDHSKRACCEVRVALERVKPGNASPIRMCFDSKRRVVLKTDKKKNSAPYVKYLLSCFSIETTQQTLSVQSFVYFVFERFCLFAPSCFPRRTTSFRHRARVLMCKNIFRSILFRTFLHRTEKKNAPREYLTFRECALPKGF